MGTLRCIRVCGKKKGFLGFKFADAEPTPYVDVSLETKEAEEYVASVATHDHTSHHTTHSSHAEVPVDLPIGTAVLGYGALESLNDDSNSDESSELTDLENQAHAQKVLLSSDAMRYFIGKVAKNEDRIETLNAVIKEARVSFPSEDGWVVVNLARMEGIIDEINSKNDSLINEGEVLLDAVIAPMTAGSLAEAIVTANITGAYEMITHRPMIALADAAADLDAVYRGRSGAVVSISHLLKMETDKFSNEQLQEIISALTSALDGTVTDEESAVKLAIAKAIEIIR